MIDFKGFLRLSAISCFDCAAKTVAKLIRKFQQKKIYGRHPPLIAFSKLIEPIFKIGSRLKAVIPANEARRESF